MDLETYKGLLSKNTHVPPLQSHSLRFAIVHTLTMVTQRKRG